MSIGEDYWNHYYETHPFKKGREADPFLQKMLHRLQKGKALDLGSGEGQNSVFLAKSGFQVKGVDLSQVALRNASGLAQQTGVNVDFSKVNLDLLIMGLMEYDTILMFDFKPPISRYYSEIIRALKQGGTLIVKSLMDRELPEALGPEDNYKNFYYSSNELLQSIKDLKILYYNEDIIDGKKYVECLAQKPMDKDAAKYNLFNMQSNPKEVTHSRQRELAEALFKKKN
jgi:SAM-dependent methyltransferase